MSGSNTGYPWALGAPLYSSDLNAAFALAYANEAAAQSTANTALGLAQAAQAYNATPKATSVTLNWPGIAVTPGTYVLSATLARPILVTSIDTSIGSAGGILTINLRGNGVTIGNLGPLQISQQTKTNTPAVAAPGNPVTVGAGSVLDVVVQVTAGIPIDAYLCVNATITS